MISGLLFQTIGGSEGGLCVKQMGKVRIMLVSKFMTAAK